MLNRYIHEQHVTLESFTADNRLAGCRFLINTEEKEEQAVKMLDAEMDKATDEAMLKETQKNC